jgi:predicted DNA-binding transcriptional regulator AlpA
MLYLKDTQLAERFGVDRVTIWKWVKRGGFPKPVKLSPGCTRWRMADIEAWEAKISEGERVVSEVQKRSWNNTRTGYADQRGRG